MLLSLSSELISEVLNDVDCETLVRCREICTRLQDIISNDIRIQYRLELFAQNMVDCGPLSAAAMSTSARLEALKSFKWSHIPKPNHHGVIDLAKFPVIGIQGHTSTNNIEIRNFVPVDGNLVEEGYQGREQRLEGCSWHETPGMVYLQNKSVLHLVQLPGPVRGIPLKEWRVDTGMSGSWKPYMDGQQDLLVLIPQLVPFTDRVPFHLRRMTNGAEHPLASFPDMVFMLTTGHLVADGSLYPTTQYERTHPLLAIYEQYIIITVQRAWGSKIPAKVIILDWKSGRIVKRWLIPFLRSIRFLDSRTLICRIVEGTTSPITPHFQIYDITQGDGVDEGFRPIPILTLNCSPQPICLMSFGIHFANEHSVPAVGTDPPFHSNPGGMIYFSTTWNDEDDKRTTLLLFTSASHLLEFVSKERAQNPNLGITETQTLDLESWPNCTFTPVGNTTLPTFSAYGMRAIFSVRVGTLRDNWMIDFNTRSWRKDTPAHDEEDEALPLKDFTARNFPTPIARKVHSSGEYGSLHLVEDGIIGLNERGSRYGNVVIIKTETGYTD
ncbi:hypothetical protein BDN72DRAFT_684025 [Pluteus cervinus]|uniref:Uncharacterized protein n=1 Tax=Pluteus cervinus TaxID=181527 RepID=A0ACD3ARV5_9AGAR|nr:hypothetical protein BDN72DRAFT_684025 [Pluteus cervinus]